MTLFDSLDKSEPFFPLLLLLLLLLLLGKY